jgi:uncharacterized protein (TIGR04562 family)
MDFAWDILDMMLRGQSGLDLQSVPFETRSDAEYFLRNYGFNWAKPSDQEEMSRIQHAAIDLIETRFLVSHTHWDHFWAHDDFRVPRELKRCELPELMQKASETNPNRWERGWACAILKLMHLICHVENSFYAHYLQEAREQIVARFEACLFNDLKSNKLCFGHPDDLYLPIVDFQVKDSKTLHSTIMKLICKKESIAEQVLDLLGVRIVTEKPADTVLALEIMRRNRIVIFANLIPSRSRNTLISLNDMASIEHDIRQALPPHHAHSDSTQVLDLLRSVALSSPVIPAIKDYNRESHDQYRAIHLTARQLIRPLSSGSDSTLREHRIFFPYEVQLLDAASAERNRSGDSAHSHYKRKKIIQARRRILAPLLSQHRQLRQLEAAAPDKPLLPEEASP